MDLSHFSENRFDKLSSQLLRLENLLPNTISPELEAQQKVNLTRIHSLKEDLSPADQSLIEAAAIIVSVCHSGHSRSGTPPLHYTHHLYQVAKRIKENYTDSGLAFVNRDGAVISEKAVAITVALLHDSMEDIGKTFPQLHEPQIAFLTVERFIRYHLEAVADQEAVNRICQSVQKLSIKNDGDFIDSPYLAEIHADQICKQVKWADVDHNMETMPDVFPLSGSIHFAAQVSALMKESPYCQKYLHQVCVSAARSGGKIDPTNLNRNALGKAYERLYHFEGDGGLDRLEDFYLTLKKQHSESPSAEAFPNRYSPEKMIKIIDEQLSNIAKVRRCLAAKPNSGE